MAFLAPEIIKRKRSGLELSKDELAFMIHGFTKGSLPEYQMSAFLMATFFQGMSDRETWDLTDLMMRSGRVLDFSHLGIAVDKHSTGGVGDKTSLILAPIAAAAGVPVPMIAGRGLGHTGGTIDKLETIPDFRCDLTIEHFEKQVAKNGIALIGQTEEICPADKKIYALRDVTATIESLPLICASIMSKKMAEGVQGLVLDVKWGSGAFMKTVGHARELAERLCAIGRTGGKNVVAVVSDMNEPLGRFIGNSLEVEECVAILKREGLRGRSLQEFHDCEHLSVELAGAMIWLGGKATSAAEGVKRAQELLDSGAAFRKFEELIKIQGGDLSKLPKAKALHDVVSSENGTMQTLQTEQIGYAALVLGAGRAKASDVIHPTAGIEVLVRVGDRVEKGQPLYRLYGNEGDFGKNSPGTPLNPLELASQRLLSATKITQSSLPSAASRDLIAFKTY